MSASIREELEREAADLRERIRVRVEELDRRSSHRFEVPVAGEHATPRDVGAEGIPVTSLESSLLSAQKDDVETPDRKKLERRADDVRERLADNIEALEKKARERLLPIVVAGGALMLFFTVGFVWMFYKTMKLSR